MKRLVPGGWRPVVLVLLLILMRQWWWPPICHSMARRSLLDRNYTNVHAWLNRVDDLAQETSETSLLRARVLRREGRMNDVQSELKKSHQLGASVEQLNLEQWLALAQSGQMSQAEPHLPALLRDNQQDLEEICEAYATGYFRSMNFGMASELLSVWAKDFPESHMPWLIKGRISLVTNSFQEAEKNFRKACDFSENHPECRLELARALEKLSRAEEAASILGELVDDPRIGAEAKFHLAINLRADGKSGEAERYLRELIEQGVFRPDIALELARTQFELGDLASAEPVIRRAIENSPRDSEIHFVLGQILQARGETDEAQAHFEFSREAQKALRELSHFRDRVHRNPKDVDGLLGMGRLMIRYGEPEEGVVRLLAALEIDPNLLEARELLLQHFEEKAKVSPEFRRMADEQRHQLELLQPNDSAAGSGLPTK
ncbi:MAG: tetratricopeptide repeat protein [Planctomycetota bacterium]